MAAVLNRLEELLKKKGIGPEGSKSLKADELAEVQILFTDNAYSLTTRATLLTALLMLPPSEAESIWLNTFLPTYQDQLPAALYFMINDELAQTPMEKYLSETIRGIDLTYDQAFEAMSLLLKDASVPDFQKGAFLEAQRLKRESFDENKAFFDVLWSATTRVQTKLPVLIDICDNYDGFTRYHNLAPFFAAAIAACGYPCLVHGTDEVAPKFGVSSLSILNACGYIYKNPIQAANQLHDATIGWGYADQSDFNPKLYALKTIRKEMVKRPFLATFEKMMQPVQAIQGNHLLTGFTHAHYRTEVAEQLKAQQKIAAALVMKGLEGSSCPPLNRETIQVTVSNNTILDQQIHPSDFLQQDHTQLPSKTTDAETTAAMGIAALKGERNEAFYQIIYYVSMALTGFGFENKNEIPKKVEERLNSGKVLQHFNKGLL